jgi:hypothetical protein
MYNMNSSSVAVAGRYRKIPAYFLSEYSRPHLLVSASFALHHNIPCVVQWSAVTGVVETQCCEPVTVPSDNSFYQSTFDIMPQLLKLNDIILLEFFVHRFTSRKASDSFKIKPNGNWSISFDFWRIFRILSAPANAKQDPDSGNKMSNVVMDNSDDDGDL